MLGGQDLDGHADGVDFLLCEDGGVSGGDAVDEVLILGSELEDGPATCRRVRTCSCMSGEGRYAP